MEQKKRFTRGLMLLPDAFSFAIILTMMVAMLAIVLQDQSLHSVIVLWGDSLWKLIPFAMQMVLILLFGSVIAKSPLVIWGLDQIIERIHSPITGVVVVTVCATIFSWINWGMGLVLGGLLAIKVGQKVKESNFALLIASAYSGFVVWHGGLSGSIPLKLASPSGFLSTLTTGRVISLGESIFSAQSLLLTFILLLTLPMLNVLLFKYSRTSLVQLRPSPQEDYEWEVSYLLNILLGGIAIYYFFVTFTSLGLNQLNLLLFSVALILHPSIRSFLAAIDNSIKSTAGIIIQFPLYAGIMGIMNGSGLTVTFSNFFIHHATAQTFPLFTYLSAGLVNFFVPSGGGQWAVQGPIIIPAATHLGVPISKAAMALAWGDAWTNMLQPFWALPLLGMSGLELKDIMGYCFIVALWVGAISSLVFLF